MRIDAHQHFWALARGDYDWLTPELADIYRDFLPADLAPMLETAKIDGTIAVQAAPTVAETEYLLELAATHEMISGVVGWIDFEAKDAIATLEKLARDPHLVGVRPMIQSIPDPDWMLTEQFTSVFDALQAHNLAFDALTFPIHLDNLHTLLTRHSGLTCVIDHASKPQIRNAEFDDWANGMSKIANDTTAFCKLSGLATEADDRWSFEAVKPYVDQLLETFGPTRLIWGSDWPVCTLATTYQEWVGMTEQFLASLSEAERAAIMGGNAQRAYKLKDKS
ncbi:MULTISPECIES: amidohydrolase family protein [Halocynthiibacter]|uniref:Amidohydrolase family protein n=1 Tax=Halocynthiibacter halioticoli TaxID=2986804 RepID=A0AAE3LPJ8_9RHOB|nr:MULTISPECIES: amidohydrolase family protein [Halocynthiibacter]MCV6823482.1 amidohydrolase family protein [Halocynthiibacter halioticoli]MCW4056483.1 amidohydrolase family protein [Halocynthiibacter sp. SDUM655004]